jgi:thioredoxin reductase (NADPH)
MGLEMNEIEKVVIVGSGPAGYTAALYTARADLAPLMVEGFTWGGLLQQTTDVENYPGYPEGVLGPEMMQDFRKQAERFGTRFITDDATRLELSDEPGGVHVVHVGGQQVRTRALILAMGAEPKKLGVPGEDELAARGVSYCATCDAAFFRGAQTIVVGGGDTAMEDATFLAKFAEKVTVVHRREDFRASAIMLQRAKDADNIELLTPYVVQRFEPSEDGSLSKAVLEHTGDGSTKELPITGAFIAIGHRPNSELLEGLLELDDEGYVLVEGRSTRTKLAGVFAAGDLTDRVYRQAVTAAGTGCMAALDAESYLRDTPVDAEAHWTPDPDKLEAAAESAASSRS